MSPAPETGRTAEELKSEIIAALNAAFRGFSFPGGRWSTGYGAEMAADALLSGPLAPILQEAATARKERDEARASAQRMHRRCQHGEAALQSLVEHLRSGVDVWMRSCKAAEAEAAHRRAENANLRDRVRGAEGAAEAMQGDPGRAAYEARFAHARPRDVEPWDSLPPEVRAIWARVEMVGWRAGRDHMCEAAAMVCDVVAEGADASLKESAPEFAERWQAAKHCAEELAAGIRRLNIMLEEWGQPNV